MVKLKNNSKNSNTDQMCQGNCKYSYKLKTVKTVNTNQIKLHILST